MDDVRKRMADIEPAPPKGFMSKNIFDNLSWQRVPAHLRDGLRRYVEERIPVGGFLTAVLENNLKESIGRADSISLAALVDIVKWLYNEAPSPCWGSRSKVRKWLGEECECGREARWTNAHTELGGGNVCDQCKDEHVRNVPDSAADFRKLDAEEGV